MKKIFCLLLTFGYFGFSFSFTFVVLGDRTGGAKDEIFKQIIEEIRLLKPDFGVNVGDLIEGYKKDSVAILKEWKKVLDMLKEAGIKWYFTPGNHDIFSELSEKIYLSLIGKTFYSFSFGNAHFIVLDNSRYNSYWEMPKEMIEWLEKDLQIHKKYRWKFVFFHRPFWRYEYEKKRLKDFPLHQIFKKYKVNYVFSGHDHFYTYLFYDSIHYLQVGPSGSRYKIYFDEKEGAFQNYLFCKVEKDQVTIAVVKPGSIFVKEKFMLEKIVFKEKFKKEGVNLTPLIINEKEEDTVKLYLTNPSDEKIKGGFLWQFFSENYLVDTKRGSFVLEGNSTVSYPFVIKIKKPYQIYPLPKLLIWLDYQEEKESLLFVLPVKRKIRLKSGEFWAIEEFGREDGTIADIKSKITFSCNNNNLFISYSREEFTPFDSLFFYFAESQDSILEIKVANGGKVSFSYLRIVNAKLEKFKKREEYEKEEIKIPLKKIFINNYSYFNIKICKDKEVFYLKIPFDFDIQSWYEIHFDN